MKTSASYSLAMAAGQDAGNRNATKHGRKAWAAEDWDAAADVANRLIDSTCNCVAPAIDWHGSPDGAWSCRTCGGFIRA